MFVLKVGPGCVAKAGLEDRSTLLVHIKVLVITGVEVMDVGELTVSVGVAEDVTVGVEVISVVIVSVETSLVWGKCGFLGKCSIRDCVHRLCRGCSFLFWFYFCGCLLCIYGSPW